MENVASKYKNKYQRRGTPAKSLSTASMIVDKIDILTGLIAGSPEWYWRCCQC